MTAPFREKPRVTHVRTGCTTCKRRRVKCSEERPHCSRCVRGGFVCAGYSVPKAWIFTGSTEAQADVSKSEEATSVSRQWLASSVHSPLQLGDSDPFDSQSVPIGPYESELLKVYQEFAMQTLGKGARWKADRLKAVHAICLSDKAATLALLARNSAIRELRCKGDSTEMSTVHLGYLTGAQAELRKKLALITGPGTLSMMQSVLWTTHLLGYAEMIHGSPTAGVHLRALSQLVVRHTELLGDQVDKGDVIAIAVLDFVRACTTLTRPMIDMVNWFPSVFQKMWHVTDVCRSEQAGKDIKSDGVHLIVKDRRLRAMILDQREEVEKQHALLGEVVSAEEATVRGHAVYSRQLFQQVQLLHVVLDAMGRFGMSRISVEQGHDQLSRAYISLAMLLWVDITSPISFTTERMLDGTGKILQHVRTILTLDGSDAGSLPNMDRYRDARLWALCIGVHTERRRRVDLGLDAACGSWFFEAFAEEVKAMRIQTWQQVAGISEQFLSLDRIQPHISQWWHTMAFDHIIDSEQGQSGF